MRTSLFPPVLAVLAVLGAVSMAHGQADEPGLRTSGDEPMSLANSNQESSATPAKTEPSESYSLAGSDFHGINELFNVREANPNVRQGAWEVLVSSGWLTQSGTDDNYYLASSVKYGVTDDMFVALELYPMNLGDGGHQANGDIGLYLFNRFVKETDMLPAIAAGARVRFPSGQGSSGVDGEMYGYLTKKVIDRLRAHFNGYVMTANGERGRQDTDDRRHFQWGVGPGFDYQIDDKTTALLNYINRSNPNYGQHNQNILELGATHNITQGQDVRLALDIGLDGQESTPNFAVKLQYGIAFK